MKKEHFDSHTLASQHATIAFFEKHNHNSAITDAVPLHEGFEAFKKRFRLKQCEK